MQKVLDLLEKHVQWVALGLGALWLLLMVWTYVLNPPAKVTIGSAELKAGEVDEYTLVNAVAPLEEAMKPGKEIPAMAVDNFADRWLARMDWKGVEPIQLAGIVHSKRPIPSTIIELNRQPGPGPVGPVVGPVPGPGAGPNAGPVQPGAKADHPPVIAAGPAVSDWRFGRSTAMVPPPMPPVAPGQPPPAPQLPTETDKDWVTQSFHVALADIAKALDGAPIPPGPIHQTAFIKVEMERQELLAGGKWGNNTIIQPLNDGMIRQPWPAQNAGVWLENAYLNWAVQNTGAIVQPAFYQTVPNKGDMWERPGEAPAALPGAFSAQQYLTGPIPDNITPDQRKQIMDARREAARQRDLQQRQNRPARQPRGRGAPDDMMDEGMMSPAPIDPDRPKFLQVRPPARQPYYPPGTDPAMMEDPAMMGMEEDMMGVAPPPQLLGVGVPDLDYPNGNFDPSTWAQPQPGAPAPAPGAPQRPTEIRIWAHDETIQPGKTYRYRARYFIKNPLFQNPGACKNPAHAKVFAVASPFSEWGPAIEVPALTNFFIANVAPGRDRVRFDVFTWEKGFNHHTSVTVGPGDVIAGSNNGINFKTGHTVVDLRTELKASGNPVVILANPNGEAVVRTQRSDNTNPIYKRLQEAVKQQQAAATAGGIAPTIR